MFLKLLAILLVSGLASDAAPAESATDIIVGVNDYDRSGGKPVGFVPYCPGSTKPSSVSDEFLDKHMFVTVQKNKKSGKVYTKKYYHQNAAKHIAADKHVNFRGRKTMIYVGGFYESANLPAARIVSGTFSKLGYNALAVDTSRFNSFRYAIAARLTRLAGNVTAVLLKDLMEEGLDPADIVLVGFSLGGQTVGFIGKFFYKMTGKKIGHIIAVDPTGICFRSMPPEERLAPTDAEFVQVLHSNIDGIGSAVPMGHVDFYINGGEYQANWFPTMPCLAFCSHYKSFFVFFSVIENPSKFIGVRCESVDQARASTCYENEPVVLNSMGLEVDKSKPGIFFVPCENRYPYYNADSIEQKQDVFAMFLGSYNKNETFRVDLKNGL